MVFFSSGTLIDIRLIEQSRSLWRSHFWSWWLQRLSKWLVQQCWWCHWPLLYKSFLRARNSELGRNRMQKSARWFTCQHSWPREKSTCRSRWVLGVSKKYFTFYSKTWLSVANAAFGTQNFWIGPEMKEGWGWTDGSAMNYENWILGEPSSSYQCATYEYNSMWKSADCTIDTGLSKPFVCQIPRPQELCKILELERTYADRNSAYSSNSPRSNRSV